MSDKTPSPAYVAELADAVRTVVGAREMCGDEAQALKDWQADNRRLTDDEKRIVLENVDRQWSGFQKAAGVTAPISPEERAQITRSLERAE